MRRDDMLAAAEAGAQHALDRVRTGTPFPGVVTGLVAGGKASVRLDFATVDVVVRNVAGAGVGDRVVVTMQPAGPAFVSDVVVEA